MEVSFKNVKSYRIAAKWNRAHLGCQREEAEKADGLPPEKLVVIMAKTNLLVRFVKVGREGVISELVQFSSKR